MIKLYLSRPFYSNLGLKSSAMGSLHFFWGFDKYMAYSIVGEIQGMSAEMRLGA